MNAGPLVELVDVDFAYDGAPPILRECSLTLRPHERVALTGPTGSGKTTLLHLIVGLLKPAAGRIEVLGKPRAREADFYEVRERVGLLFQAADDQLFCPTVAEDVAFGPLNLGKPREEVRRIVERTLHSLGLAGYQGRITYRLSGGEKRLVALATVLAMQPDVLLLDEPTSGLDPQAEDRLVEVLAGLDQAMLVVSHDREFLARVTDSRLELHDGRVV
jgi:cobalt/nickel transport system ATP-binding protein